MSNADETECILPECQAGQGITEDGRCETCLFSRPSEDKKMCIKDECEDPIYQIHKEDGTCAYCEDGKVGYGMFALAYRQRAAIDGVTCERDRCRGNEKRDADSGDCQQCPDYTRANEDETRCLHSTEFIKDCGTRQKVTKLGQCETCHHEDIVNPDDVTQCIPHPSPCGFNAIGKPPNNCKTCPDYAHADREGLGCLYYRCQGFERLDKDGHCVLCLEGEVASDDGKTCI